MGQEHSQRRKVAIATTAGTGVVLGTLGTAAYLRRREGRQLPLDGEAKPTSGPIPPAAGLIPPTTGPIFPAAVKPHPVDPTKVLTPPEETIVAASPVGTEE